jgi:hypothetical protein
VDILDSCRRSLATGKQIGTDPQGTANGSCTREQLGLAWQISPLVATEANDLKEVFQLARFIIDRQMVPVDNKRPQPVHMIMKILASGGTIIRKHGQEGRGSISSPQFMKSRWNTVVQPGPPKYTRRIVLANCLQSRLQCCPCDLLNTIGKQDVSCQGDLRYDPYSQ